MIAPSPRHTNVGDGFYPQNSGHNDHYEHGQSQAYEPEPPQPYGGPAPSYGQSQGYGRGRGAQQGGYGVI